MPNKGPFPAAYDPSREQVGARVAISKEAAQDIMMPIDQFMEILFAELCESTRKEAQSLGERSPINGGFMITVEIKPVIFREDSNGATKRS